jgi:pSer/pThr/pTyr-binding forkhead associated (FHA) protein
MNTNTTNLFGRNGYIIILDNENKETQSLPLDLEKNKPCIFGRRNDCDIWIKLQAVSRRHAQIEIDDDNILWINPISETSITLLNGSILKEATELQKNDIISIGGRNFRFEKNGKKKNIKIKK